MGIKIGNKDYKSKDRIEMQCDLKGIMDTYSHETLDFTLKDVQLVLVINGKKYIGEIEVLEEESTAIFKFKASVM